VTSKSREGIQEQHRGKYRPEAQANNPGCSSLVHGGDITVFPGGGL
jgi:hypothetical protein